MTTNFGPISSLTWRSRSRSSKSRSSTWRRIVVHSCQVSSKSDHKWQSYIDLKFRVFGTKMGQWPWKVGQGHWNWVSVLRSTWGPYLYRFRVWPINFGCEEKRRRRIIIGIIIMTKTIVFTIGIWWSLTKTHHISSEHEHKYMCSYCSVYGKLTVAYLIVFIHHYIKKLPF